MKDSREMIVDESFNLNSYQPQVKQGKISRNASRKVSSGSERFLVFFSFGWVVGLHLKALSS